MNVLIVEDESLARERLVDFIKKYDRSINIVNELDSVEDAVSFLQSKPHVDLTFLDIRLSDGLSFEIFNKISVDQPVIFTTAYDNYALKAFKVNSVDYLLKPIDYDELVSAIDKFKRNIQQNQLNPPIDQHFIKNIVKEIDHRYKKRFIVKFGEHIQFKAVEDIAYIFAENKTVYIHTRDNNRKYIIDHTLDDLENTFLDPDYFFRINRKFIVHIDAIEDVRNYVNSRLKLRVKPVCDMDMVVSREKVNDFKSWLNQ